MKGYKKTITALPCVKGWQKKYKNVLFGPTIDRKLWGTRSPYTEKNSNIKNQDASDKITQHKFSTERRVKKQLSGRNILVGGIGREAANKFKFERKWIRLKCLPICCQKITTIIYPRIILAFHLSTSQQAT